jgi:hypothetical protein
MSGLSVLFKFGVQVEGCFDEFMHTGVLGVVGKITEWTLASVALKKESNTRANELTEIYPFTRKQGKLRNLGTDRQIGANDKLSAIVPLLFLFANQFPEEPCPCERMTQYCFSGAVQAVSRALLDTITFLIGL